MRRTALLLFLANLAGLPATEGRASAWRVTAGPGSSHADRESASSEPGVAQGSSPSGPIDAGYYFLLGRHLEGTGEIEKAVAAHKQAIALLPGSAELRAELAGLYARQEQGVEAIQAAEAALELDPQNREANRIAGSVYAAAADRRRPLRAGESPQLYVPRAIAALERARQGGGSDAGVDLTLGRLYVQTASYDKAIPILRRIADDQPGYSDVALLLATAETGAGRTDDAIRTLRRAIDQNPRFVRGLVLLAELNEKQGRWDEAADAYARAQKVSTRGMDLAARRAAALINAGKAAEARDLLEAQASKPGADPLQLYLFAAAQRQAGDLAGAEATARKLHAAAPDDPRGHYILAQVLEARGDVKGAEESLRDLLRRDPADATALNYLGYMLAERGERLDEAVDLVQRALKEDPGNPAFLDSLGWAYYQQGKLDLADGPLTEAAEKMPQNSVIQDHLGDLRYKQRRFADAAAAWERSLAGDGESIDRSRIQKKLEDARSRMEEH
jgi:tetratricopeptide (TPR) repeat protein